MSAMSATGPGSGVGEDFSFQTIRDTLNGSHLDGDEVADELVEVRDELGHRGAKFACERLQSIDRYADALRFDVIRDVVAPDQVFAELEQVGETWSRRLSAWRNVIALLPLLLTWLALGLAAFDYHDQLSASNLSEAERAKLLGTPFLDLWQSGFGGRLWLTFARTAIIDLILLSILVMVTILMHVREGGEQKRASDLAGRLNRALAQLAIALQLHDKIKGQSDPVDAAKATAQAITQAGDSMRKIGEENERLIKNLRQSMDDAKDTTEQFITGLSESMRDALAEMRTQYTDFVSESQRQVQEILRIAKEETETVFVTGLTPTIEKFTTTANIYDQSAITLSRAATMLGTSSDELRRTTSGMDGHIASLDTNIGTVAQGVDKMREAAEGVVENNKRIEALAGSITGATSGINAVSPLLREAAVRLNRAAGRLPVPPSPPPPPPHGGYPPPPPPGPSVPWWKRVLGGS